MRKPLLTTALCLLALTAAAQSVVTGNLRKVDTATAAFHPVIADDGNILVTGSDYRGLIEVNTATKATRVLSTAPKAGLSAKRSTKLKLHGAPEVTSRNCRIVLTRHGQETILAPNGAGEETRYIWPVLSPDGTRIAYTVSGDGTYVCNLDGTGVQALGVLRAPRWINNNWLVGMVDYGSVVTTASRLYAAKADGSYRQAITPEGMIAMFPDADAKQVVFEADGGDIYLMDITVND